MNTLYSRTVTARRIAAACGVGVLLVGATACGSTGHDTSNASTNTSSSGAQSTQRGTGQFPGASGKVAEVDGSTAQVQSQQSGQVAVTWNDSTTFTQEVDASLSAVKVGDCVVATPNQSDTSTSTDTTQVTAANVRISAATGGTCTAGFGGGPGGGQDGGPSFNGAPPSGAPSGAPSGIPSGAPSGAPRAFRGSFGAVGKVTAVSGSGFTVSSTRPGSDTATTVAVTTTGATRFTTNAKATASDVKVGRCLVAQGTTDATGAVTARTVALSAAVDGECGGGFFRSRSGGTGTDASTTGQAS